MQITQLIDALRKTSPVNFIWGSGCSGLYRSTTTYPGDPETREAVKKYDSDPLLSQIKRKFFHRTAGLEDVHSCLLALHYHERKEVLTCRTNWANICMAELLRLRRAARILTTNFDGSLVGATATFRMLLPLYRQSYPELRDASTPCIYLLGDAPPEILAGLLQRGAPTGPWIVIGASGRHIGLSRALLAVDRYEHGLYWIGHFHEEPPAELRDGLFTAQRNAYWITGFDADSFMAYLLRGLGEFPPPALVPEGKKREPETCLRAFEKQRAEMTDSRQVLAEMDRIKRGASEEVRAFLEKLACDDELASRSGHSLLGLGIVAHRLASYRSPREVKPFLEKAADLMEPDAPGDVFAHFADVCSKLAQFSGRDRARVWYARAEASYAKMDFGPHSGAPLPYGHLSKWVGLLDQWSAMETGAESEAMFERARAKFSEMLDKWADVGRASEMAFDSTGPLAKPWMKSRIEAATRQSKAMIGWYISALHRRARRVGAEKALPLFKEARTWLDELRRDEGAYTDLLLDQLSHEAEVTPDRQAGLLREAKEQFQNLLRLWPDKATNVRWNWAWALGRVAMACSGDDAFRLYGEAEREFQEVDTIKPNPALLHENWGSILIGEARERGGSPEYWERARRRAERANAIDAGQGSYNLACIAAETEDREGVARWLEHSAEYGKIPRLWQILEDISFARLRPEAWFVKLLDAIFDAGLGPAPE